MNFGVVMKHFAVFCMLFVPATLSAQKQYLLPTGDSSMDEKERPLIEVYLPKQELANGCAGANAELHMYGDGKGPYELMLETGETTTEGWSAQMMQWLKAKGFVNRN